MHLFRVLTCAAVLLPAVTAIASAGDSIFDVEHARALALSDRPVSESNAWYLDRYGALSGSGDWRTRVIPTFGSYGEPSRRVARQKPRRSSFE